MSTYRFDEIRHQERRAVVCACGRLGSRQRTFTQTVNPFNRNAQGALKTIGEIRAELRSEGAAWAPEFTCAHCTKTDASADSEADR